MSSFGSEGAGDSKIWYSEGRGGVFYTCKSEILSRELRDLVSVPVLKICTKEEVRTGLEG